MIKKNYDSWSIDDDTIEGMKFTISPLMIRGAAVRESVQLSRISTLG